MVFENCPTVFSNIKQQIFVVFIKRQALCKIYFNKQIICISRIRKTEYGFCYSPLFSSLRRFICKRHIASTTNVPPNIAPPKKMSQPTDKQWDYTVKSIKAIPHKAVKRVLCGIAFIISLSGQAALRPAAL